MSANVGYATINVIPSAKDFGKSLGGQIDGPLAAKGRSGGAALGSGILGAASSALGPIAGIVAGVFATGAIVSWGQAQVDALARIEQINKQTETVLKSTGNSANVTAEGVENLAGRLESLTGTEAESIQEGANLLLTFKNIKNEAGAGNDIFDQTTVAMVDMARAMGTDAKGGAVQLGKALNDPVAGISALTRVGITFSDEQKNLIGSLVESGNVMEAQKIILGELNSQFGGSGQAYAETYAGKIDLLGHAWGTFGETLFSGVMPVLGNVAGKLTDVIEVATGVVDVLFNGNFDGGLFAALGIEEDSRIVDFLFNVRDWVIDLFSAFEAGSPAGIGEMFGGLILGLHRTLPVVVDVLVGAMASVGEATHWYVSTYAPAAIMLQVELLELVIGLLPVLTGAVWQIIPPILSAVLGLLPGLLEFATSLLLGVVGVLKEVGTLLVRALVNLLPPIAGALVEAFPGILSAAVALFGVLVDGILVAAPVLLAALLELAPVLIGAVLGALPTLLDAATTYFLGLVEAWLTVLPPLIVSLLEALPMLVSTLLGMLPTVITTAINLFFGLVTGLLQMLPQLLTAIVSMLPQLVSTLVSLVPTLITTAVELFSALITGLLQNIGPLLNVILFQVIPQLIGALLGAVPQLLQAGVNLIGGLVSGLWRAASSVGQALLDIIGGAVDGFLGFLGIHSPSRLFKGFGVNIGEGLVGGIAGMAGGLRADVESHLDRLAATPVEVDGGWVGQLRRASDAALRSADALEPGRRSSAIDIHSRDPHAVADAITDRLARAA